MGLSRAALWALLADAGPVVAPILMSAYELELEREWREEVQAPHGQPWFTSFHASSFPGDSDEVCGRRLVYGLLDPPAPGPRKPFLQAWFEHGSNLEHDWIKHFTSYGVLLTANVTADDDIQTGFEDEEHWLTGSCDAIILPRGWSKSHVVEVKTTSHEKVLAMLADTPSFPRDHGKYLRQLKTYIGLAHELPFAPTVNICDESGAIVPFGCDCPIHRKQCAFTTTTLLPPDDGTLIYSSREESLTVASFRAQYDRIHMERGRERLAEWRDYFLRDEIPPHPCEGRAKKWTSTTCQYCPLKAAFCKADYTGNVTKLSESGISDYAQAIRPDWNLDEKRAAVLQRWNPTEEDQRAEEMVA